MTSGQPVLETPFTAGLARDYGLNLVDDAEAEKRCRNGRLYTSSENALEWIHAHLGDMPVARHIDAMKDSRAARLLAGMYPDFFSARSGGRTRKTDVSGWKKPFILKPSVGFFSLGVYTITSDDDWTAAVADIERNLRESRDRFPESVVDQSSFLVEEYITGEEFAVDVYFDGEANRSS
ncbi:MAG: ATP-grasp domain-containing protein [Bilophila wadsworthia]